VKGDVDFDHFPPIYGGQEYFRDNWGCLWHNAQPGILGRVAEHPLQTWDSLQSYSLPDPRYKADFADRDWEALREQADQKRAQGRIVEGGGERLFDLFYSLRGFENFMLDLATGSRELDELLDRILEHKIELVGLWLEMGVDVIRFHGDIGTQRGPMVSPQTFRRRIKPLYESIFSECRKGGAHVFYSSDGNLLTLVDDLFECGVSLHDPQYRVHTLDGIARTYGGRMCVMVDLDQQQILPFGTPQDVKNHVADVVRTLNRPEGGLMIFAETQPNYPLDNIAALCDALEEHCLQGKPDE
jgi:uroporphyrinogen decarboxylase